MHEVSLPPAATESRRSNYERRCEKHVQKVAVEWLASFYADRAGVRAVHTETETRVVAGSKLGSGRADGLVASLMDDGTVYTASLEAKSA